MNASFQRLYVALLTDAGVRERFADAPEALGVEYGVDARGTAALRSIDPAQLDRFARSLVHKRFRGLAEVAPLTLRVWPRMKAEHRRWATRSPDPGDLDPRLPPGCVEGLRALPILRAAMAKDELSPSYGADLLAYEVLSCSSRRDLAPRELTARYRVDLLGAELRRGIVPMDPEPAPTRYLFEGDRARWKAA